MFVFKHKKSDSLIFAFQVEKDYIFKGRSLVKGDWIVIAGAENAKGISNKTFQRSFKPFGEEATTEFGKWEEWDTD